MSLISSAIVTNYLVQNKVKFYYFNYILLYKRKNNLLKSKDKYKATPLSFNL